MRTRHIEASAAAIDDSFPAVAKGKKEVRDAHKRKSHAQPNRTMRRAKKMMVACVETPQVRLVNYAERHRAGERVANSRAKSGADHLVKARMARTQHVRWSEQRAFNVLLVRAAPFNQHLAKEPVAA